MTGLANDEGFASFLEHDLRPRWSIFTHLCKLGKSAYLVDYALFIFDGTEFTGACYESSHHPPSLIASHGGYSINHYGFFISHQRNSAKPSNERFLATPSNQRCRKSTFSGRAAFGRWFGSVLPQLGWCCDILLPRCGSRIVERSICTHSARTHCWRANSTGRSPDIRLDRFARWYNQSRRPERVAAVVFLLVDRWGFSFSPLLLGRVAPTVR